MVSALLPPAKACRPVAISYSTAPKLKMSVLASSFSPRACSGDLWDGGEGGLRLFHGREDLLFAFFQ